MPRRDTIYFLIQPKITMLSLYWLFNHILPHLRLSESLVFDLTAVLSWSDFHLYQKFIYPQCILFEGIIPLVDCCTFLHFQLIVCLGYPPLSTYPWPMKLCSFCISTFYWFWSPYYCSLFQFTTIRYHVHHKLPIWSWWYYCPQENSSPSVSYDPSEIIMPRLSTLFLSEVILDHLRFFLILLVSYHLGPLIDNKFIIWSLFEHKPIIFTKQQQVQTIHKRKFKAW